MMQLFFGCLVKVKLLYLIIISAGQHIYFWLQISNDFSSGFDRLWIQINLLPNTICLGTDLWVVMGKTFELSLLNRWVMKLNTVP